MRKKSKKESVTTNTRDDGSKYFNFPNIQGIPFVDSKLIEAMWERALNKYLPLKIESELIGDNESDPMVT
jgi:hypothetical protein